MPPYRSTPKSEPLVKIKGHYQGGVKLSEYVKAVRSQYNKQVVEWTKSTDHMVVKKPERTFGAFWMDDFVALEKSVSVTTISLFFSSLNSLFNCSIADV